MKNIYGMIATQEVAYAKKKPIYYSPIERGAGRVNNACKQIYATVLCCFARQDDPPCRPRTQQ
jgi:hypothetical protein